MTLKKNSDSRKRVKTTLEKKMKKELSPAQNVVQNVCKIKKNERVLIIANPSTAVIAQDLYSACLESGATAVLVFQNAKTSFENAEPEVLAAIETNPDVCFSVSENKLGKDPTRTKNPLFTEDGRKFDHIFDYLLDGKKSMRAVWSPGITQDMFSRTVNIDYSELSKRCETLQKIFKGAVSVTVTSAGGTNLSVPIKGRNLLFDNGDFSKAGNGGNVPCGEVFISPIVGTEKGTGCQGTIVYDGSMTFSDGDSILETPITCKVEDGFVTDISGGSESRRLLKTILEAEMRSIVNEKEGKIPNGMGAVYKKNARNIGELGIGLNPAARITGNMLEDEKAFNTCHFAIGENYDGDAPSLIHLDGVVKNPTITLLYEDGTMNTILDSGKLTI